MSYDKFTNRLFAAFYDTLDRGVQSGVDPYRKLTAGESAGRALEIGAGTGANLPYYPQSAQLFALEPNPHMRRRFSDAALRANRGVRVIGGVGERLPFADASFDTVVTTLTLCMVRDLDAVISEIRRVLVPGGAFLFYEHVASDSAGVRRLQTLANPLWKFATTGCNLDRDIGGAIRAAGFSDVDYRRFTLSVLKVGRLPNIVGCATR